MTNKYDKSAVILSAIVISLGGVSLLLFWLSSKDVISREASQYAVKMILSLISLVFAIFSVVTKKAPYRCGLADKNVDPVEYYLMTALWFVASFVFGLMAIKN